VEHLLNVGYMIRVFIFIHTKNNCSIFIQQESGKISAWMTTRLLPIGVQYWCSSPMKVCAVKTIWGRHIDNAGQGHVKGQYVQTLWPGGLDVECAW
jgi:hypothetical protein